MRHDFLQFRVNFSELLLSLLLVKLVAHLFLKFLLGLASLLFKLHLFLSHLLVELLTLLFHPTHGFLAICTSGKKLVLLSL